MCISGSVGALAQNRRDDVKTVQIMLNFGRPSPFRPLDTDGAIGKATIDAIHEYQTRVVKANSPDARVDPGGDTLRSLRLGIPQDRFYWGHLQGVALQASTARVDRYYPALARHMGTYGIDTPLRRAHFWRRSVTKAVSSTIPRRSRRATHTKVEPTLATTSPAMVGASRVVDSYN
jgi:hypothetical protein